MTTFFLFLLLILAFVANKIYRYVNRSSVRQSGGIPGDSLYGYSLQREDEMRGLLGQPPLDRQTIADAKRDLAAARSGLATWYAQQIGAKVSAAKAETDFDRYWNTACRLAEAKYGFDATYRAKCELGF